MKWTVWAVYICCSLSALMALYGLVLGLRAKARWDRAREAYERLGIAREPDHPASREMRGRVVQTLRELREQGRLRRRRGIAGGK